MGSVHDWEEGRKLVGKMMGRREKFRLLKADFVREMKVSICRAPSGFKGFLENGSMSPRKGWSSSIKGNPVETFGICLNSAMKAKRDESQGQKLSGLWGAALHLRGMFLKTLAWEVQRHSEFGARKV